MDDAVDDDDDIKTHLTTRWTRSPRVFFRHCRRPHKNSLRRPPVQWYLYYVCSRRVRPVAVSVLKRAATAATTSAWPKKINPSRALRVPPPPPIIILYYSDGTHIIIMRDAQSHILLQLIIAFRRTCTTDF